MELTYDSDEIAWEFRILFEAIRRYEGSALFLDILNPWLGGREAAIAREWLHSFGHRVAADSDGSTPGGHLVPSAKREELWNLYALSRVNESLLLSFQPESEGGLGSNWYPAGVTMAEYLVFMRGLGLTVVAPTEFSPFHHEIVEVTMADDDEESPAVIASFWPCLMLGEHLLFSRAGVHVQAGKSRVRADVATSSALFWTYRRRHRPAEDLSDGWGSNSQWRTEFRRDYRFGCEIYFNVDGKYDVDGFAPPAGYPLRDDLTVQKRSELVAHRCFVTEPGAVSDPWPYHYSLRLRKVEGVWVRVQR